MKFLIDTNVIIDYLADRDPFAEHAEKVMKLCVNREAEGMLTANAVTDIYYILRKAIGREEALESLRTIIDVLNIVEVGKNDILQAVEMNMPDFEDAIIAVCAKRVKAQFIVTRNRKDFMNAPVESITPEDLLIRLAAS